MKTYFVLLIVALGAGGEAAAQVFTPFDCPQLATLEQSRAVVERLRAEREAGIDRLPTARHRELANRGLYEWYWQRLADFDRTAAEAEADCRAAQIRSDGPMTRASPLPEPLPDAYAPPNEDPFQSAPPAGYIPSGPPPHMYEPYPRYPSPYEGGDPFGGPVEHSTIPDPFAERWYPRNPPEYRYPTQPQPRVRAYPRYRSRWGGWEYDPRQPYQPYYDPFSGR